MMSMSTHHLTQQVQEQQLGSMSLMWMHVNKVNNLDIKKVRPWIFQGLTFLVTVVQFNISKFKYFNLSN